MTANIETFAANNNLTASDIRNLDAMIDAYGHLIDLGTLRVIRMPGPHGHWIDAEALAVSEESDERFRGAYRAFPAAHGRLRSRRTYRTQGRVGFGVMPLYKIVAPVPSTEFREILDALAIPELEVIGHDFWEDRDDCLLVRSPSTAEELETAIEAAMDDPTVEEGCDFAIAPA